MFTGLDAAGPYFENTDPVVRLDPTDADFIDVIHTDTQPFYLLGFGIEMPIGHVDFYPNGGIQQPGCGNLLETIGDAFWELLSLDLLGKRGVLDTSSFSSSSFIYLANRWRHHARLNDCTFLLYH